MIRSYFLSERHSSVNASPLFWAGRPADFDGDCSVGILDLLVLLGEWG